MTESENPVPEIQRHPGEITILETPEGLEAPSAKRWLLVHALLMLPAVTLALETIGLRRRHPAMVAARDRSDTSFRWTVGLRQSVSIDFTSPVPLQFPDSHWVRFAT